MEVQKHSDQRLGSFGSDVLQSQNDLLCALIESIHRRANHRVITLIS
jgi:hypothetical protein